MQKWPVTESVSLKCIWQTQRFEEQGQPFTETDLNRCKDGRQMFFLIIGYTKINQNDTNIIKPTKELQKMDEERKTTKKNLSFY